MELEYHASYYDTEPKSLLMESWTVPKGHPCRVAHGQFHRDGKPALIIYHQDYQNSKKISHEYWFQYGVGHREDGPSSIMLNNGGGTVHSEWSWYGEIFDPMEMKKFFELPIEDRVALKLLKS